MARVKKPTPSLESLLFATPEQKVLRFLLSEPTTTYSTRVISSKLKGIRGLGGAEGIVELLHALEEIKLVEFVDNQRSVRLQDDQLPIQMMKIVAAICDLEGLKSQLEPLSHRGVLFGSRAVGKYRSDSDYDVFVVTEQPEEAKKIARGHPLGKKIELLAWTPNQYDNIEREEPGLAQKLSRGIALWGPSW